MAGDKPHIAVVGAGVIGAATALFLTESGFRVTLIDRKGVAEEASFGNAGAFAFTDILPLASPGTILKAPRWLFDPLGPLSVPPAYAPRVAPWLFRFLRAGSPKAFERGVKAQTALMRLAESETEDLLDRAGLRDMIVSNGALHLYEREASYKASMAGWKICDAHGIEHEHLDRAAIEERQARLSPAFTKAVYTPVWHNVSDPHLYAKALADRAVERGAIFVRDEITEMADAGNGVTLKTAKGETLSADRAVICAGAWSHHLARKLGDRIPLETERGYNTTLAPDAFQLSCQLIFEEHGFVVSPLTTGVRVGGAVELGGLKRAPDFRRSQTMLDKAARFMPGLKTEGGHQWMGFRPSIPDSLPVIGHAPRAPRVIYAFGHGHLGLTQSAATARLVTDLALDRRPAVDLTPYAPDRF